MKYFLILLSSTRCIQGFNIFLFVERMIGKFREYDEYKNTAVALINRIADLHILFRLCSREITIQYKMADK